MKTQELFKEFLKEIADSVSGSTYSVWFNDLELVSMQDKVITIKVPLPVHKQILRKTYIDLIDETMFSLTGINYEFNFVTEDEIETEPKDILKEDKKETNDNKTVEWNTNLKPELNFDNYIVGESNRLAYV